MLAIVQPAVFYTFFVMPLVYFLMLVLRKTWVLFVMGWNVGLLASAQPTLGFLTYD